MSSAKLSTLVLFLLLFGISYTFKIEAIFPPGGPTAGLTKVSIFSQDFKGLNYTSYKNPRCRFGFTGAYIDADWTHCSGFNGTGEDLIFEKVDPTSDPDYHTSKNEFGRNGGDLISKDQTCLSCVSPVFAAAGDVSLQVSLKGDFSDQQSVNFSVYVQPQVTWLEPFIGKQEGGTIVKIHGSDFRDYGDLLKCGFGAVHVAAKFVDSNTLICRSPPSDIIDAPMYVTVTQNIQQASETMVPFYYYDFPEITQLVPNKGPNTGGTSVGIYGKSLHPFKVTQLDITNTSMCKFGENFMQPLELVNQTVAYTVSPATYNDIPLRIEITFNGQEWTNDGILFYFYSPPYVFELHPNTGPLEGGSNVTVIGANFENTKQIRCKFGNNIVNATYIDENHVWCIAPKGEKADYVQFFLALSSDKWSGNNLQYLYYKKQTITSLGPLCGPTTGYTQIKITGTDFLYTGPNKTYCVFGNDMYMDAVVFSDTLLYCDSPRVLDSYGNNVNTTKNLTLRVTFNGGKDFIKTNATFNFYTQPKEILVTPHFGPIAGGTNVTIIGDDFSPYCNLSVRFTTTELKPTYINSTTLSVLSPQVECPNDVEVDISLNGQQYTKTNTTNFNQRFSYYKAPLIVSFSPKEFPSGGHSTLTVVGEGFLFSRNDTSGTNHTENVLWYCKFTDETGQVVGVGPAIGTDDTQVKCDTPAVDDPKKKITVALSPNKQDWYPIVGQTFNYYQGPKVKYIDPKFGPLKQKGKQLTVTGDNFHCPENNCNLLRCRFQSTSGNIYTEGQLVDEHNVRCVIPPVSKPESDNISVTFNGHDYTAEIVKYTFFDAFMMSVDPSIIPVSGNTPVKVTGYGFAPTGNLKVRLGSPKAPLKCNGASPCIVVANYVDDQHLNFTMPPQSDLSFAGNGSNVGFLPIQTEVSIYGDDFTESNLTVQYYQEPKVGSIDGTTSTSDPITIPANNSKPLKMPVRLNVPPGMDPADFIKRTNATCRFKVGTQIYIVSAQVIPYLLGSTDSFQQQNLSVVCTPPAFLAPGDGDVSVSINGKDYIGSVPLTVKNALRINALQPACGPLEGGTKVKVNTSGWDSKYLGNVFFMWDTICTQPLIQEQLSGTNLFTVTTPPTETRNFSQGGYAILIFAKKYAVNFTNGTSEQRVYDYLQEHKTEFFYYKQPIVKRVQPHSGLWTGGTRVEIEGAFFFQNTPFNCTPKCKFGDQIIDAEYLSTVRIICRTPRMASNATKVPVEVSMNGFDYVKTGQYFTFVSNPVITSISPTSGPGTGGTLVTLKGENFTNLSEYPEEFVCVWKALNYDIPAKTTPASFKNSTTILCITPGGWGTGTTASVEISYNGYDTTNSNNTFRFAQTNRVAPLSGPAVGGTIITVTGTGFQRGDGVGCKIDGVFSKANFVNTTVMQCTLPESKHGGDFYGKVDFSYSLNGQSWIQVLEGFTYYAQPVIKKYYPKAIPRSGGIIYIEGDHIKSEFYGSKLTCKLANSVVDGRVDKYGRRIECEFGKINIDYKTMSAIQNITISLNDHVYELKNGAPVSIFDIVSITPTRGPVSGGTSITISGYGFQSDTAPRCRFGIPGNNAITFGSIVSSKVLVCRSPPAPMPPNVGALPFVVPFALSLVDEDYSLKTPSANARLLASSSSNDQTIEGWSDLGTTFTYYDPPVLTDMSPKSGSVDKNVLITIKSNRTHNFGTTYSGGLFVPDKTAIPSEITCRFGDKGTTKATLVDDSTIQCLTPDTHLSKLDVSTIKVKVQVAPNGVDYIDTDELYTFEGTGGVGVSVWIWILAIIIGLIVLILLIWWVYLSNRRRDRGLGPLSIVPPHHSELIHRSNIISPLNRD